MSRLTTRATRFVAALAITLSGTAVIGGTAQAGEVAPAGASTSALCYTHVNMNGGRATNHSCPGAIQYVDTIVRNGKTTNYWANKASRGYISSNWACYDNWYTSGVLSWW